jgi:hypothetical protein
LSFIELHQPYVCNPSTNKCARNAGMYFKQLWLLLGLRGIRSCESLPWVYYQVCLWHFILILYFTLHCHAKMLDVLTFFLLFIFLIKGNLLKICTLQMIFNIKTWSYYVEWVKLTLPSHKVFL